MITVDFPTYDDPDYEWVTKLQELDFAIDEAYERRSILTSAAERKALDSYVVQLLAEREGLRQIVARLGR